MLAHRMTADGTMEGLPMDESAVRISAWSYEATPPKEPDVRGRKVRCLGPGSMRRIWRKLQRAMSLDEFVGKLPTEDLIHLVCGQPNTGIANTYGFKSSGIQYPERDDGRRTGQPSHPAGGRG